jgi:hypothetical protein
MNRRTPKGHLTDAAGTGLFAVGVRKSALDTHPSGRLSCVENGPSFFLPGSYLPSPKGAAMPIRFRCPGCQKALAVKEQMANRTVNCPNCNSW